MIDDWTAIPYVITFLFSVEKKLPYIEIALALILLYKSTILCKNRFFRWLLLCVKLAPAFIQIITKNSYFYFCFEGILQKIHSNP